MCDFCHFLPRINKKITCTGRRLQLGLFWIYFSALAEFDQIAQITILPTLQWADLFFAPGSIYLFTCVGIPSDPFEALASPHNNHKRETIGNDGGCGDSGCGGSFMAVAATTTTVTMAAAVAAIVVVATAATTEAAAAGMATAMKMATTGRWWWGRL